MAMVALECSCELPALGSCPVHGITRKLGKAGEDPPTAGLITREHALAVAQNVARGVGYAVAVHGSRVRDLDLVAIPWIEDTAYTPLMIAETIARALPGVLQSTKPEKKPHGRVGFVIHPQFMWGFDHWYIDLSVMPRRRKRKPAEGDTDHGE